MVGPVESRGGVAVRGNISRMLWRSFEDHNRRYPDRRFGLSDSGNSRERLQVGKQPHPVPEPPEETSLGESAAAALPQFPAVPPAVPLPLLPLPFRFCRPLEASKRSGRACPGQNGEVRYRARHYLVKASFTYDVAFLSCKL